MTTCLPIPFWKKIYSNRKEFAPHGSKTALIELSSFKIYQNIEGLDALGRFSAIFDKGDNFGDFIFAFLYFNPLLNRGLP